MQDPAPPATVSRLITYLRTISRFLDDGFTITSSEALASATDISAFQIRKDLAYFGTFGTRGSGYDVRVVHDRLREILGLTDAYNVAIIGMGRLGQAITDYPAFGEYGFAIRAMFDRDPRRIGEEFAGVTVSDSADLAQVVHDRDIDMALITVPAAAAQSVADEVVKTGVTAILNFAPVVIRVPDGVVVETVDFLAGLKRLSYHLRGLPVLKHSGRHQTV